MGQLTGRPPPCQPLRWCKTGMPNFYILRGRQPVAVSFEEYLEWVREGGDRFIFPKVGDDMFPDGTHVSTIFMASAAITWTNPPRFFETMILGGPEDGYQDRSTTWEEAEAAHQRALLRARRHYPPGIRTTKYTPPEPPTRFHRLGEDE